MAHSMSTRKLFTALTLMVIASWAHAVTLHVNCAQRTGLTTIAAAIKVAHSTLLITDSEVTGNNGSGVSLESGSEALFYTTVTGNLITGNGDYGVLVADLSLADSWTMGNGVSGNHTTTNSGQPDVQCLGKASAVVGVPLNGTISAACGP